jgi:ABC-type amino acid transport system permease subunit
MDFRVIADNFSFLMLQGLIGFGPFAGGTLRLALPAIVLGFVLGTLIGLARLARSPWVSVPAARASKAFAV